MTRRNESTTSESDRRCDIDAQSDQSAVFDGTHREFNSANTCYGRHGIDPASARPWVLCLHLSRIPPHGTPKADRPQHYQSPPSTVLLFVERLPLRGHSCLGFGPVVVTKFSAILTANGTCFLNCWTMGSKPG